MFPTKTDKEIAEIVAKFFNKISTEYEPITPAKPVIKAERTIEMYEIAARLRHCKKPKSRVHGDIPSALVKDNADLLAMPLYYLFNSIIRSGDWPKMWKSETVRVLQKNAGM